MARYMGIEFRSIAFSESGEHIELVCADVEKDLQSTSGIARYDMWLIPTRTAEQEVNDLLDSAFELLRRAEQVKKNPRIAED